MLLGKRPRAPMRRTTSMTEFSAGDLAEEGAAIGDESRRQRDRREAGKRPPRSIQMRSENNLASMLETAQFLRACGLCKRRLGPGLDAFIYRQDLKNIGLAKDRKHYYKNKQARKIHEAGQFGHDKIHWVVIVSITDQSQRDGLMRVKLHSVASSVGRIS